jgi:acylpyruvate hydrolase
MLELIELGARGRAACDEAVSYAAANPGNVVWRLPAGSVGVEAPLKSPRKFLCIGLNYRDHAKEAGAKIPTVPVFFNKFASSITGPFGAIVSSPMTKELDYEIELGIVIAKRAKNVPVEDADQFLYGYTVVNDVSARDLQHSDGQWVKGKALDTYAPIGPCIVTKDEIPRPENLGITLSVNGEVRQCSNTKELIFDTSELISYLSNLLTLEPGDIIATGTPSGIGNRLNPPRFLKPGDVVRAEIEKIGVIENTVVAEEA